MGQSMSEQQMYGCSDLGRSRSSLRRILLVQVYSHGVETDAKSDCHASHTGMPWQALDDPMQAAGGFPYVKSVFHLQSELTDWLLDDRRPEGCRLESFEPLLNWVVVIDAPQTPPYLYRGQTFRYTLTPYSQMVETQYNAPQEMSAYQTRVLLRV